MPELLWLLAVPAHMDALPGFVKTNGFDWAREMSFPAFPSASLDTLLELSEEVGRAFSQLEQICRKIESDMGEIPDIEFTREVDGQTPAHYLGHFSWSESTYALKRGTIHEIVEEIMRSAHVAEHGFREAHSQVTSARNAYINSKKALDGPLTSRSLANLIHTDSNCWFESDNMTTVVCVVQRHILDTFIHNYPTYSKYIVPDSACFVTDDENSQLITLIAMKEHIQDVVVALRREKIAVREFVPVPSSEAADNSNASGALKARLDHTCTELVRAAKDAYPACFTALCYAAVIRAYVESTLKFGLRDSDGKDKGKLIIAKVSERSEKVAKGAVESKILRKLYISETKVLGHDTKVYDNMDGPDSFLPFVFLPIPL